MFIKNCSEPYTSIHEIPILLQYNIMFLQINTFVFVRYSSCNGETTSLGTQSRQYFQTRRNLMTKIAQTFAWLFSTHLCISLKRPPTITHIPFTSTHVSHIYVQGLNKYHSQMFIIVLFSWLGITRIFLISHQGSCNPPTLYN